MDGPGSSAQFSFPTGVAVDSSGNLYVVDLFNHRIRKVTADGAVSTLAGTETAGFANGRGSSAQFDFPIGVAVDSSGNVYVADRNNNRIRKVTADGVVGTLAGSGTEGFLDGPGSSAQFDHPEGVAVDSSGNVYVADTSNNRIRKVTAEGEVSTLAGSGTRGFANGPGRSAWFNNPSEVAVDSSDNVYVADYSNNRIRKIVAAEDGTVMVSTLAGSGKAGFKNGASSEAQFDRPAGVAVDSSGNIYVADRNNNRIRKVTAEGEVSTLVGSNIGTAGFKDDSGSEAQFHRPGRVAVDSRNGNIYVADTSNHSIRMIEYR